EGKDPTCVALVPVSDYKAFIGNFTDAQTEGEITTFHVPSNAEDMFATSWGGYAAVSQQKDALAKKPEGLSVDGAAGKEVDSKDLVVIGNFKAIRAKVLPMLASGREKITGEFEKGMANVPNVDQKLMPVF